METGLPVGDWSRELKSANSLGASYSFKLIKNFSAEAGIEVLSYRTISEMYHINVIHAPIGFSYPMFRGEDFNMILNLSSGASLIERSYKNAKELGLNEFYFIRVSFDYNINMKKVSSYIKYLQERFINGKSYLGIGISLGFSI